MSEPRHDTDRNRPRDSEEHKPQEPQVETREKNLDQTIADSFPASDPPSSDPNPEGGS